MYTFSDFLIAFRLRSVGVFIGPFQPLKLSFHIVFTRHMHQYQYWLSNKDPFHISFAPIDVFVVRFNEKNMLRVIILAAAVMCDLTSFTLRCCYTYRAHIHPHFSHQNASATHLHFSIHIRSMMDFQLPWCILIYFETIFILLDSVLSSIYTHSWLFTCVWVCEWHVYVLHVHYMQLHGRIWISAVNILEYYKTIDSSFNAMWHRSVLPLFVSVCLSVFFPCRFIYTKSVWVPILTRSKEINCMFFHPRKMGQ